MSRAKMKLVGTQELVSVDVDTERNTVSMGGRMIAANEVQLDVPITGTVFGTLLNYKGTLAQLGNAMNSAPYNSPPKAPILYIKPVNTFISFGAEIPMPSGVTKLEMGAALGLVIGKRASAVNEEIAMTFLEGYTIVNDVSVPHPSVFRPAVQHQARDGFCPIGPWIIERQDVVCPDNLTIRVFVNDQLRQENSTSNLIRSVSKLLADVTGFMTLSAGDVLLVGFPEKAPQAEVGDKIRIEIEGLGSLENVIVEERETQWRGRY